MIWHENKELFSRTLHERCYRHHHHHRQAPRKFLNIMAEADSENSLPTFRPFTREELAIIHNRIMEKKLAAKKKAERRAKNIAEFGDSARARKLYEQDSESESEDEIEQNPKLEQGNDLPRRYGEFPLEFASTPICDIDPYFRDKKSFIVISKGGTIFRFSAENAMFLLSPYHPIRRIAIHILTHTLFNLVIMATILVNCYVMIKPDTEYTSSTEVIFTAIYTYESAVKLIARGFFMNDFTYLRDAWNWLDFSVIGMSYVTIAVDLGSFSALRTFRVFRALKSVAVIPGLKTFPGSEEFEYWGNMTAESFHAWYSNKSSWYLSNDNYIMCGNASGAGKCPDGTTCMEGFGPNPNYGYTSFDNFGSAYLCAFRLMTQDFWENLYQITLRTAGPWHIIFFMCNIFLGSFYLINLILAIVAMSYDELQRLAEEEAQRELEELEAIKEAEEAALAEAEAAAAEAAEAMEGIFGDIDDPGGGGGGAVDPFPESPARESLVSTSIDRVDTQQPPEERMSLRSASLSVYRSEDSLDEPHNQLHRIRQTLNNSKLNSLPASPFVRRTSKSNSFSSHLRLQEEKYGNSASKKPLVLFTFVDAQEHLPYADDSTAVTPKSELNGGIVVDAPNRINNINSRKYSYNSHTGKIDSYNSHTDLSRYNNNNNGSNHTKEGTLRIRMASLFGDKNNGGPPSSNNSSKVLHDPITNQYDLNRSSHFINNNHERKDSIDIQDVRVLSNIIDQVSDRSMSKATHMSRYIDDGDADDDEGLKFKDIFCEYFKKVVNIMCIWDCCWLWIKTSQILAFIVFDPFTELFITICIAVNVIFMALDRYDIEYDANGGMSPFLSSVLTQGNYFFTTIFAVESFIKLVAMSPRYFFSEGWNCFDFLIVVLSLVELLAEGVSGLSMLRSFRLLRVFKLAKSWKSLNDILTIMANTFGALSNLTFVLCIIIFIFAVMGMQLFGKDYYDGVCEKWDCDMPRWNFTDFLHSFMIVFRVLCGEWIESMWDCIYVAGVACIPLLPCYRPYRESYMGGGEQDEESEPDKMVIAFQRFGNFRRWVVKGIVGTVRFFKNGIVRLLRGSGSSRPGDTDIALEVTEEKDFQGENGDLKNRGLKVEINHIGIPLGNESSDPNFPDSSIGEGMDITIQGVNGHLNNNKREDTASLCSHGSKALQDFPEDDKLGYSDMSIGRGMDISITGEGLSKEWIGEGEEAVVENGGKMEDVAMNNNNNSYTEDPVSCSEWKKVCPCCIGDPDSPFWQLWYRHRLQVSRLIENKYFEGVVLTLILLSSFVMTLEDIWFDTRPLLVDMLYYLDRILTVVFFLETLLKLFAMGCVMYFGNAWCWLDFVIVAVSLINFGASLVGLGNIPIFKTMRTLRALRPLRAMAKMEGMKVVVNALVGALPSIFNVFFTLNLLVGVIIDKFNEQKNKGGSSLDAFMTEDQKKYIAAMKKASTKKRAQGFTKAQLEASGHRFLHHNPIKTEMLLKMFALRHHYFAEPWNLFDFVVVMLSLAGLFLSDLIEKYFVSPTLLRVVRVAKVGRVLRLIKGAKGIRTLLFSLVMAFPALVNICLLLFLVMFIFAVFGMSLFKNVKIRSGFDDVHNFRTFGKTFTLLFQMCTSAGWAEALDAITDDRECDKPSSETGDAGNCGNYMAGVAFMIIYLILSFLIIVNMYIAVILENYSQANEDVQEGITDEDYDLFYEIWQEFDPDGTQYMPYKSLSEFLDVLEPPLQIAKPNKFKIIHMDIPIVRFTNDDGSTKEQCVFCADILDALTQDFFARKGNPIEEPPQVNNVKTIGTFKDRPGYQRISSSLWKQREDYCAALIQKAWKFHKIRNTETQTEDPQTHTEDNYDDTEEEEDTTTTTNTGKESQGGDKHLIEVKSASNNS
ncbi:SCN2A [Lepeophtheirus salmonis]|uniref:Sodium channel protein n=1 Tax=Lepeophtheirus salmonis TaxID=72036 RepID=A0A7R8CCF5_LEPSM|nr:SCN2A [Lepeophtheirus salmonis]CAF2768062.1 SCN2A [Lepeophtheirus salmonis]